MSHGYGGSLTGEVFNASAFVSSDVTAPVTLVDARGIQNVRW